jgi:hypothetical protein
MSASQKRQIFGQILQTRCMALRLRLPATKRSLKELQSAFLKAKPDSQPYDALETLPQAMKNSLDEIEAKRTEIKHYLIYDKEVDGPPTEREKLDVGTWKGLRRTGIGLPVLGIWIGGMTGDYGMGITIISLVVGGICLFAARESGEEARWTVRYRRYAAFEDELKNLSVQIKETLGIERRYWQLF